MTAPQDRSAARRSTWFPWVLFPGVFVAWLLYWWILVALIPGSPQGRGQHGDMFGGLNTLFSGLALAGIIVALWYQRQELELQREQLMDTRRDLDRAAQAQEENMKALRGQLRVMALGSRLTAITLLIKEETAHMRDVHNKEVESQSVGQLQTLRNQVQQRIEHNQAPQGDYCLRENLEGMICLRQDLKAINDELRRIATAGN